MSDTDERDADGNPTPWALAWQVLVLDRCSGCTGRLGLCLPCACRRAMRAERTRAETAEARIGDLVDAVCHCRNLAIVLGASPTQMLDGYDRALCEKGIADDGCIQREAGNAWDAVERLEAERDAARQIIAGIHGALADAGDVPVPCDVDADLAPAVRELVRQRDVARGRSGGLEAERCALPASEVLDALETALAARCHSRTVVPGASESPECAELPTMCSRHARRLMAALREAESAAATAVRERHEARALLDGAVLHLKRVRGIADELRAAICRPPLMAPFLDSCVRQLHEETDRGLLAANDGSGTP